MFVACLPARGSAVVADLTATTAIAAINALAAVAALLQATAVAVDVSFSSVE